MFPFLIGKVLTEPAMISVMIPDKFPFLIGKVLTLLLTDTTQLCTEKVRFPFLIGKVLTNGKTGVSRRKMFPFLIGKVLTVDGIPLMETSFGEMFPFLIGKVLTRFTTYIMWRENLEVQVSIPYR